MDDLIHVNERWYVSATSPRADARTRVLKHGDAFAVFDRLGDIQPAGLGEQGLYRDGTRFLSRLEFSVSGVPLLLLNSAVSRDNNAFSVDLTLPEIAAPGGGIPRDSVHIRRSKQLCDGVLYETVELMNYAQEPVNLQLALNLAADYSDIFEVRGQTRAQRGTALPTALSGDGLRLGYHGLDARPRYTQIRFDPVPDRLVEDGAGFDLVLQPREPVVLRWSIACDLDAPAEHAAAAVCPPPAQAHGSRLGRMLYSSNEQFNEWLGRSAADLELLVSHTPYGPYPYAGVPWFSTAFGRDGIITALQTLWLWPELARGVLHYLAAHQSQQLDRSREAQPGKILHEMRGGEMAALREIPFGSYYGTADATPLFVVLAAEYHGRTGDEATLRALWPAVEAALDWIDRYGDVDGDGFVEYQRQTADGLEQQGWKDSFDSISHADGAPATGAIALCEVQAYVYAARCGAARLARVLGQHERAVQLEAAAAQLRRRFNEAFWCEDIGSYALALDGRKQACRVRASNAGHALWAGIAEPAQAATLAKTLLAPGSFSGWGLRTLAEREARYNPMSYHNGSVWPHDNAIVMAGLARYGFHDEALRVFTGLFDASLNMELMRLPELFCGFPRRDGEGPTLYPVACAPQAWAAGSVFQMLQNCLGLSFSLEPPQLRFERPRLPVWIDTLEIRDLPVGEARIDLALRRHENDVSVNVLRQSAPLRVAVLI